MTLQVLYKMVELAQKHKSTENLHKIALTEDVMTKDASKIFIKRMLAIGISNIMYLRNLFPEHAYSDRQFEGLSLKILKEHSHEGATQIVNWMRGVYDALDREYLRILMFAIVKDPEDSTSIIESYSFGFTYLEGTVQADVKLGCEYCHENLPSKKATFDSAKQLLRNVIVLVNSLDDLPDNVYITSRLLYYDDVTPCDYQPPSFDESLERDCLNFFVENIRVKLGRVITPFTNLKLRVRIGKHQFGTMKECERHGELADIKKSIKQQQLCPSTQPKLATISCQEPHAYISGLKNKTKEQSFNHKKEIVRCPCGCKDDDDFMIMCSHCHYYQHAICFCIPDVHSAPEIHLCNQCSDQSNKFCTDPHLPGLEVSKQQEICVWRRTLQDCFNVDTITVAELRHKYFCSLALAQDIIHRLKYEGIVNTDIHQSSCRKREVIDLDILHKIFNQEIKHVSKNMQQHKETIVSRGSSGDGGLSMRKVKCHTAMDKKIKQKYAKINIRKRPQNKDIDHQKTSISSQVSTEEFQITTRSKPAKMSRDCK